METRKEFQSRVKSVLDEIGVQTLSFDKKEFWIIQSPYDYVEYYAVENRLFNTAIALNLSRGLHDGSHRKSSIIQNGVTYRLPYLIHPLLVCRMLIDLQVPLSKEEEDILLAAALCHDMIEDISFAENGKELYKKFHLDKRVYDTVKLVSKRKDFTEEEERKHFHEIESDKLALLVKLSDRGNNVEDLYNMSVWKVHEYVAETEKFIFPMCRYGMDHFPEIIPSLAILQDKINCLTGAAKTLVDRYEERELDLKKQVEALREENKRLREEWKRLWEEE